MVDDKLQARAKGPVDTLTRQPLHGKAKGGGIRFGEMERDCIIAHGAAMFMKDRLLDCSDKFTVPICSNCGLLSMHNLKSKKSLCKRCQDKNSVYLTDIPYAMKLLLQELMSMGIATRLFPK